MENLKQFEKDIMPILFSKVTKNCQKQYDEFLKPYGLSKIHAFYLICLKKFENGLKLTELNSFIGCDKANTSRAISDLEDKGIICKEINAEKEKKYYVKLTAKGLDIANEFESGSQKNIEEMLGCLNKSEQEELFFLIKKILKGGDNNDTN